jgi:hypothetical protein
MSNVLVFPKQFLKAPKDGFRINLYTDAEVEMTLFCINIWGRHDSKYSQDDLRTLDPIFVRDSLNRGYDSNLLSYDAKQIINTIVKSIEPINKKQEVL